MKKIIVLTALSLLLCGNILAQDSLKEVQQDSLVQIPQDSLEMKKQDSYKEHKNAIGISAGSPGFGFDYARKFSDKFSAKLRYNTFKIEDYSAGEVDVSGNTVDAIISGESSTIDLLVEYQPFKRSSFKLVGGVGILSKMNLNILMEYDESVAFGDVILTKEDYGNVAIGFDWEGIAPYLGLGFGRAVPKSNFGFSIEAGSYFTSSPKMSLVATKLLTPTADQVEEIEETFKSWKFIPLMQFRVVYAF
jgi:hypothetical protein